MMSFRELRYHSVPAATTEEDSTRAVFARATFRVLEVYVLVERVTGALDVRLNARPDTPRSMSSAEAEERHREESERRHSNDCVE